MEEAEFRLRVVPEPPAGGHRRGCGHLDLGATRTRFSELVLFWCLLKEKHPEG